jgi:aryl carrier-like protein
MGSVLSNRAVILREIRAVAEEQNKSLEQLTDDLALLDSGLDSLCITILVSRLEEVTGRDPFYSGRGSHSPRTVGELIAFYDNPC